jgi:hypothetical protein
MRKSYMSKKVIPFRKRSARPMREQVSAVGHRVLGTILGLSLFLAFGAGAVLFLVFGEVLILALLPALCLLFIALFWLNLAWQSLRGQSDQEGFFYTALTKGHRLHPAAVTLGAPIVLILALLESWVLGSPGGVSGSVYGLVAYGVWLAHIGLHELGHYLAAQGVELVPYRVLVGPLEWTRAGSRWKLGLCPDWFSLLGGQVQAYSPVGRLSARQELRFAIGGPLMTAILLAVLAYWNPYSFHELVTTPPGALGALFSVGLLFGMVMLLVNLIPIGNGLGGVPTDGYRIRSALRSLRGQ